jgi:hypothetical protein
MITAFSRGFSDSILAIAASISSNGKTFSPRMPALSVGLAPAPFDPELG